jgi:hypothetical protein
MFNSLLPDQAVISRFLHPISEAEESPDKHRFPQPEEKHKNDLAQHP